MFDISTSHHAIFDLRAAIVSCWQQLALDKCSAKWHGGLLRYQGCHFVWAGWRQIATAIRKRPSILAQDMRIVVARRLLVAIVPIFLFNIAPHLSSPQHFSSEREQLAGEI